MRALTVKGGSSEMFSGRTLAARREMTPDTKGPVDLNFKRLKDISRAVDVASARAGLPRHVLACRGLMRIVDRRRSGPGGYRGNFPLL